MGKKEKEQMKRQDEEGAGSVTTLALLTSASSLLTVPASCSVVTIKRDQLDTAFHTVAGMIRA